MPKFTAVIDLETIPDRSIYTPPPAQGSIAMECDRCKAPLTEDEDGVRVCPQKTRQGKCRLPAGAGKEVKTPFAPLYAHQVCVLGFALFDGHNCVALSSFAGTTPLEERDMLVSFGDFMVTNDPRLVTWAGRKFDVPVALLRSLRHGVAQAWYSDNHGSRYNDAHLDLAERYGTPERGMSLDEASKLIGLPGKNGFDGSMVADAVAAGELAKVTNYCLQDVVQTSYLLLRYRLLRGVLTVEQYKEGCAALKKQWAGAFDGWDELVNFGRLELF